MIGVSVEACLAHDLLLPVIFWYIDIKILRAYVVALRRRGGLMVGALVSRSSVQRHSFVFLGKTVCTLSVSINPGI